MDLKVLGELLQFTNTQNIGEDEYSRYEKRFEAMRKTIPSNQILGYVSDNSFGYKNTDFHYGYNLTQYSIAPSIIVSGMDREMIIGNFINKDIMARIIKSDKLILLKDFGDGVMLFRRKAE